MLTIYGIVNCDTCRKARRWLTDNDIEYAFHDFRSDGVTVQMLERWCDRIEWQKILNKRSLTWRKIPQLDRQNLSRSKALSLMLENPTLIRRPVLETDELTAVGYTEDGYREIIERIDKQDT